VRLVLLQRIERPLPARLHRLDQPAQGMGAQGGVGGRAERQAAGDLAERVQVQPVGAQLALRRRLPFGAAPGDGDVAAGPGLAVLGRELQPLRLEPEAGGRALAAQPPRQRTQHQRFEPGAERGAHVRQHHVGRAADDLPPLDVRPRAQPAAALGDVDPGRGKAAQLRDVHFGEVGVQLARPLLPQPWAGRQQRLAEGAGDAEAPPRVGRRRGVQPQEVAPRAVARDEIDLPQRERRRAAQFVRPLHGAAADHEFALAEEPVGRTPLVGAGAGEIEPGDEDAALPGAPDLQLGRIDIELLEAEIPDRTRRQRADHQRQAQGLAALRIEQHHVAQGEGGHQALAARADRADAHRHAQHPARANFQLGAQVADSRHNDSMQPAPSHRQQQRCREQQPQGPLDHCGKQPQRP